LKKGDPGMYRNLICFSINVLLVCFIICTPTYSCAFNNRGGDITALDAQTFIVTWEFAGEIRLYLCSVKDGRISIKDSGSIPYMTIEHRDLGKQGSKGIPPDNIESPIIKTVP
jgi:hypothetical protein